MERVTVSEAAARLGITPDAVRQRIRRGTIEYEKTADGRYYVYLTPHDGRRDGVQDGVQKALIERLHDENEWLRREVERKDTIIMQMAQRIPELEPATEPRGLSETAPAAQPSAAGGPTAGTEGPQKPARQRSWLYRFFFGPS